MSTATDGTLRHDAALATADPRPTMPPVEADNIPAELRALPQWVAWRYHQTERGDWTKRPCHVANPAQGASSTDPSTWSTFAEALALHQRQPARFGIGFVFAEGGGMVGIDLDRCRDPETGALTDAAEKIAAESGTYCEVSPSQTGVKIFGRGELPAPGRQVNGQPDAWGGLLGKYEVYRASRFFTVTGAKLPEAPGEIGDAQGAINRVWEIITAKDRVKAPAATVAATATRERTDAAGAPAPGDVPDDETILAKARAARNGAKFSALWSGDTSGHGGDSSSADQALVNLLAYWCGPDERRVDALFRRSGLMRDKWDERRGERTYGQRTIAAAIELGKFHDWGGRRRVSGTSDHQTEAGDDLPRIDASDQHLPTVTAAAWRAIEAANDPPRLFVYGGLPSRLGEDEDDRPRPQLLDEDRLRHEVARAARWFAAVKGKNGESGEREAKPPRDVVRDMLACPVRPLPVLRRVVEAPVFAANGELQIWPGYHPAGRVYYHPARGFEVPSVSERPTAAEIAEARGLLLDELLHDFPFVGPAEAAHTLALVLLPFVRDLIYGPTPLHLIEKPSPGTGATLLVDAISYIVTGRPIPALTEGRDEDEWRKRLTAKLRSGSQFVMIDNLRRRLDSAAVASAITSPCWEDRLLGASETIRLPITATWVATGNNPAVSNEMARRIVRIRLDARSDRPWLRETFRHADLRGWVRANRGRLVWACLTIGRAWLAAGRPKGGKTLGMFESWAATIGGILEVAGVPDLLGNLEEFYQASDAEGAAQRSFICAWQEHHGTGLVSAAELYLTARASELEMGDGTDHSQRTRLGRLLASMSDRVYRFDCDGEVMALRVERAGAVNRATRWRLVRV